MKYIYHFCAEISDARSNRPQRVDGIIHLKQRIETAQLLSALRDKLLDEMQSEGKAQDGDQVVILSLSFLHELHDG